MNAVETIIAETAPAARIIALSSGVVASARCLAATAAGAASAFIVSTAFLASILGPPPRVGKLADVAPFDACRPRSGVQSASCASAMPTRQNEA